LPLYLFDEDLDVQSTLSCFFPPLLNSEISTIKLLILVTYSREIYY